MRAVYLGASTGVCRWPKFYAYSKNNQNLLQATDRNGHPATYTYDPLNRLKSASYADGSSAQYTWDAGNRLTQIVDIAGNTITRTHNGLDEVLSETSTIGSGSAMVVYQYDTAGNRKTMQVPSQSETYYTYDHDNRLTQIAQGANTVRLAYGVDSRYQKLTLRTASARRSILPRARCCKHHVAERRDLHRDAVLRL